MAESFLISGKTVFLGPYSTFVPAPLPPMLEWTPASRRSALRCEPASIWRNPSCIFVNTTFVTWET